MKSMDRKRLELIGTAILVVVFVFLLSNSFKKTRPKRMPPSQAPSAKASPAQQAGFIFGSKREIETKDIIDVKAEPWGRNPFILEEVAKGDIDSIAGLRLMGVTASEKAKSMAIINNEIVSVGSVIGKFKILSISKDRVIVNDGERDYELRIGQ